MTPSLLKPATPKADALVSDITSEFPSFEILPKKDSALQRAIDVALKIITLGGQRSYLTRYHTVLFGKLWVPLTFDTMADDDRVILLRHERVHLRQRRRMGEIGMAFVYLVPFFPLFLAYGRARIEWEAYEETLRATAELLGIDAAEALRPMLIKRFVGPDYGWMWPFPSTIHRWIDRVLADIRTKMI